MVPSTTDTVLVVSALFNVLSPTQDIQMLWLALRLAKMLFVLVMCDELSSLLLEHLSVLDTWSDS